MMINLARNWRPGIATVGTLLLVLGLSNLLILESVEFLLSLVSPNLTVMFIVEV